MTVVPLSVPEIVVFPAKVTAPLTPNVPVTVAFPLTAWVPAFTVWKFPVV